MALFEPEIGMARDWDLFTMATVALVPLTLFAVNRLQLEPGRAALVFVPAMTMTAVLSVSWIGVNASAERTTERFEAILAYDQTHAGYAYENLATFYYQRRQLAKAIAAMEKGALISGNPRLYARLAAYYQENGDLDAAIELLSGTLKTHPTHDKARQKYLDLLEKAHRWRALAEAAREGMELHPRKPIYCFAYGVALLRMGRAAEAVAVFRDCIELDAPPELRDHMQRFIDSYEEQGGVER
jgi:tetratricopeptide (TPR) repeat protein